MIRRYHVDRKLFVYEFPFRHGSMVLLAHRKLFAKGFLFGLAPCCCLPTGNCSRMVSCPPWLHGVACPQETVREGFPIRLGSMAFLNHRKLFAKGFLWVRNAMVFLTDRKLFAKEISRLRFAPLEMTKGRGSMLFLAHRKLFAGRFLDSARNDRRAWLHGTPYLQETFHSPSYPCKLSSCRGGSISLYLD